MFKLSNLLLNPRRAKRHPIEILLISFFYASLSLLLSMWIFPEYSSLIMVFLTVISCSYVVQGALIIEEKKERAAKTEYSLLKSHSKLLALILFMFLGFVLAFTFWTLMLSENSPYAFSIQNSAFQEIASITGRSVSQENFALILSNNIRVMLLSLLFALFFGAGAIFILAWNASIMGFVIGSLAKNSLGISFLPLIFTKYFLHGIPEMLAYITAALAGSILFIAVIKGDIKKDRIIRSSIDIVSLIVISVLLLVLAALIEVFISPYI